jgi:hypothetical protein
VLDREGFTDFGLRNEFTANSRLAKVVAVKFFARPRLCAVLCQTIKQAMNLKVHEDSGRPGTGIPEILETKVSIAEFSVSYNHEKIPKSTFCSTRSI